MDPCVWVHPWHGMQVCCALRLKRDTRWNDGTVEGSEEPWKGARRSRTF